MKDILIAIPSYNREASLDKILKRYSNYNIDVLVFGQGYSDKFVAKNTSEQINFFNYTTPALGVGYIRKNMLEYIFEKSGKHYEYIVMHDDDLMIEKDDIKLLSNCLTVNPDINISTIDIYGLCNNLRMIKSDVIFSVGCFRASKLKDIYTHLTADIKANEDAELVYLMGNKGILINKDLFKTIIDEPAIHSDSVIPNRKEEFEKSSKKLVEKYGRQMKISYTATSKNMITKFESFKPTIVYFEGVDKTGKTSLIKEFNKQSNFEFYSSDRSPISTMVYADVFGRKINKEVLRTYFQENKANILIVYTHCSASKIKERIKDTNHEELDVEKHLEAFDEIINYMSEDGFNIIKINTNQVSAEKNAENLINRIKVGDLKD